MIRQDEINYQFDDIVIALIREVVLRFHRHKTGHRMQYDQSGAIVHFFFWDGKEPVEILHLQRWMLIFRP
jgi:hypothetical protein